MNIGKAIKDYRQEKGLTQLNLAVKAGYTECWVMQIEKKKLIFNLEPVYSIADALEIKLSQLFERAENIQ